MKGGQKLRLNRAKGFTSYQDFLQQTRMRGPNPLTEVGSLVEIPGPTPLSLICLNTALFSDKDFSEAEEKGKSPLPIQTFRQLAEKSRKSRGCHQLRRITEAARWMAPRKLTARLS